MQILTPERQLMDALIAAANLAQMTERRELARWLLAQAALIAKDMQPEPAEFVKKAC